MCHHQVLICNRWCPISSPAPWTSVLKGPYRIEGIPNVGEDPREGNWAFIYDILTIHCCTTTTGCRCFLSCFSIFRGWKHYFVFIINYVKLQHIYCQSFTVKFLLLFLCSSRHVTIILVSPERNPNDDQFMFDLQVNGCHHIKFTVSLLITLSWPQSHRVNMRSWHLVCMAELFTLPLKSLSVTETILNYILVSLTKTKYMKLCWEYNFN